ncbi:dihydrolipoamide acetyltransferase family protein [Desulfospira joergensenii]|uniref:dihydrolipoamide acetyltransferase family protein n=1 Tax=Desulfospira joergensenii TaxID=53329 RepID=UPI0003B63A82|nr:dihydrolipoamide acetyltransferase family protein [Desulfospira joergensenii]
MFEFKLPDLGEGIHEGELIKWHVSQGQSVKEDDPLCDMETDKALVTIPSPRAGTIAGLTGSPGDIIRVGEVFVVIEEEAGSAQKPKESRESSPSPEPAPKQPPESPEKPETPSEKKRAVAAPAVRRVAREMGIDINRVTGTGPGGRVTREDLKAFEPGKTREPETSDGSQDQEERSPRGVTTDPGVGIPFLEIQPLPDYENSGPVEREPIRSLRRKTAVKTTTSSLLIPHVAHMDEIEVTELESIRQTCNRDRAKEEKITLMAFVIRGVSALLKEFPEFNASLDPHKMEIIYKKFYHIGFAADTPRGLMVPVIRQADQKSVATLAREIRALAQKGKEGSISPEELSKGTFSVTNVGAVGGTHVFPIINYPESAILGLGRVRKIPMVKDEEIRPGLSLPVTLSFDHRLADGVRAALFIGRLKAMLEDPKTFMTEI